jgi:hypothetical protein
VPCRMVSIERTIDHGTAVSLDLVVHHLALSDTSEAFQTALRTAASDIPIWSNEKGLKGYWCLPMNSAPVQKVDWSDDTGWHALVGQLASFSEFETKDVFIKLLGIRSSGNSHLPLSGSDCWYKLKSHTRYVFEAYHYHPKKVAETKHLQLSSLDNNFVRLISSDLQQLDSRYGILRFNLLSSSPVSTEQTSLIMDVTEKDSPTNKLRYEIPIQVERSVGKILFRSVSIGVFVAFPGMLAAYASGNLSFFVALLMLGFGVCAGVASTLILPRSV